MRRTLRVAGDRSAMPVHARRNVFGRVRKFVATVGALVAVAATQPAIADDTVGVNAGLAGFVAAGVEEFAAAGVSYRVSGVCAFAAIPTPANTLIVAYGGAALATGPVQQTTPLLTAIGCRIKNASGNNQYKDISLNGSASAVADSTLLATSGPKEWPVEVITICVTAFGIWAGGRIVTLPETCRPPKRLTTIRPRT